MTPARWAKLIKLATHPVLLLLVGAFILAHEVHKAREEERQLCNAANLQAEVVELKRQKEATKAVLAEEEIKAAKREEKNFDLQSRVNEYERYLQTIQTLPVSPDNQAIQVPAKPDSCNLTADDLKRLRNLK